MSHLIHNQIAPAYSPAPYSPWYDAPVILRVAAAQSPQSQTELHCTITGESDAAVHIRIGECDQDIAKKTILAVEEIPAFRRLQ